MSLAGDAMIARLADHAVRIWRGVKTTDARGGELTTYEVVGEGQAVVNRSMAPTGDAGAGLDPIGRRRIYMESATDVLPQDVIEFMTGPEAPQTWLVDELPTRPRDHHVQLDCMRWRGILPAVPES